MIVGGLGDRPGRFAIPRAIDVDGGYVFVADRTGRVQMLDAETGRFVAWWRMPDERLGLPTGLTAAVGPNGKPALWVADTHYHRVLVYDLDEAGALLAELADASAAGGQQADDAGPAVPIELPIVPAYTFGSYGFGRGEFIYPTDVAVLMEADGVTLRRVYVGEYGGNDRISVYGADLQPEFEFGVFGVGDDGERVRFNRPQSLVIDVERGHLLVADSRNHRIGRFTLEGELIAWTGSPETLGVDEGQMRFPWSLALLEDGSVLIVENGNNRVQRLLAAGADGVRVTGGTGGTGGEGGGARWMGTWGRPGHEPGELSGPWAIAAEGRRAWVVDTRNHRLQVMDVPARAAAKAGDAGRRDGSVARAERGS